MQKHAVGHSRKGPSAALMLASHTHAACTHCNVQLTRQRIRVEAHRVVQPSGISWHIITWRRIGGSPVQASQPRHGAVVQDSNSMPILLRPQKAAACIQSYTPNLTNRRRGASAAVACVSARACADYTVPFISGLNPLMVRFIVSCGMSPLTGHNITTHSVGDRAAGSEPAPHISDCGSELMSCRPLGMHRAQSRHVA